MSDILQRIQAASAELNGLTDAMGERVRQLEEQLGRTSLGISAAFPIVTKELRGALCYMRIGKTFRIAFQKEGTESPTPWSELPRGTKLETYLYIPHLLQQLSIKAHEMTCAAENGLKLIEGMVTAINKEDSK